ncbi:MAG TPA: agmatinase [bacterium]|nr:agmatinase [bacterium]
MNVNFFDLSDQFAAPETAKAAIVSIPYEHTVSYGGGAGLGPRAIYEASTQVELYDEVLRAEPYRAGICADPLADPQEVSALGAPEMIERYRAVVGAHLDAGRFPVILGGEHTVSLAPFAAVIERYPQVHVLHLDAHADLRDRYHDDPYSHACVLRRIVERASAVQLGIRSYDLEQAQDIPTLPVNVLHAHEIRRGASMIEFADKHLGDPVYLTIDLDAFDPSIMPATGTPEPNGLYWQEVDDLLAWLFANRNVVAMDVVELAPREGWPASDFLAARLIYRCIGRRCL